jgi:hypothetical protein
MRTILACFVLLSLALNSIAQDLDCGINVNGVIVPSANKCISTGAPACVNVGEGDELVYRCRQCYSNCDCDIGTYCIKTAGTDKGTCRDIEDSILSRTCNRFNTESDRARAYPGTLKFPQKGIDEETVCGIAMFEETGNFTGYEWFGYCDAVSTLRPLSTHTPPTSILTHAHRRVTALSALTSVRLTIKKSPLTSVLVILLACCALAVLATLAN